MGIVEKTFRNGEVIVKEGDSGSSFFQLVDGTALVYAGFGKNDQIKLGTIEAGEYFGEMAILEAYPRSATIVASGTVTAIEITKDELEAFLAEDPNRIIDLMQHLGNRVWLMNNDYIDAQNLLKELRENDEEKKNSKSLFSSIKKHIDMYQSNKNKLSEPEPENLAADFNALNGKGMGKSKSYRRRMIIFDEGAPADCMYILHSGTVCICKNRNTPDEIELATYEPVSIFGEIGMISEEVRSNAAVSVSDDTRVEIIYPEDLVPIFEVCPEKINIILKHLSYRLRKLNTDFLKVCKEITENYNKTK